jgi:hypothetical protein
MGPRGGLDVMAKRLHFKCLSCYNICILLCITAYDKNDDVNEVHRFKNTCGSIRNYERNATIILQDSGRWNVITLE